MFKKKEKPIHILAYNTYKQPCRFIQFDMEIPRSIETLKKTFDEAIKLYMLEILRSL